MAEKPAPKWRSFLTDESTLFVIKIVAVYAGWKVLHRILHTPGTGALYSKWQAFAFSFGAFYAAVTSKVLNFFGEPTIHTGLLVQYIPSLKAIRIEEHCLAIPAMVIFAGSILLFKGSWRNKLWFVPFGIVAIFLINTLRLILLCVTYERFSAGFYQFNHSYVYVIFSYTLIFLLIAWWMKSFAFSPAVKSAT